MNHKKFLSKILCAAMISFFSFAFSTLQCQENEAASRPASVECDIWIRGGDVIDGTGAPARGADVLVKGDKIVYIGPSPEAVKAAHEIDATGRVVAPGFIDAHAHGNPLEDGTFHNFLAMGVTTICLGQDGGSPGTENIDQWMQKVNDADPALNIAMFVGHGTLRDLAGVGLKPEPSEQELDRMVELLENAMEDGCFGMSTGLEYLPGRKAAQPELITLSRTVGKHGGMVMSHMRTEDKGDVVEACIEFLEQGLEGDVPVHVSHIKVVYGKDAKDADAVLAKMQEARERGLRVTADVYPYTASYTGIGIVFPDWAKPPHVYEDVVAERREELEEYLRNRVNARNGPEATLFGTKPWAGKTLAEVAAELNKPFEDVLIEDIGPDGAGAAYFVMSDPVLERFLQDPHIMISSDGSPTMRHPRGYGSFARVINRHVMEKELLSLEEAIHKMTGLPAETLGMIPSANNGRIQMPRGILKEGYSADIVVFHPEKVKDTATFENPHQLAEGFDAVIVNGEFVRQNGAPVDNSPGRVLKHSR